MDVTIAASRESERGVAVVAYSGRLSRVYDWDIRNDIFIPGQFVKARARAIDVSDDGKYFTYEADAFHKREQSYIGVAHIPFFTAIAFFPTLHVFLNTAHFGNGNSLVIHAERKEHSWVENYDLIQERIEPGCPFKILREEPIDYLLYPLNGKQSVSNGYDFRRFIVQSHSIYEVSDYLDAPKLIHTFDIEEFQEVPPPDWAKVW